LLEIPNRRCFDVFQPGTLNREPFYFLNLEPGTDQFQFKLLLGHDTGAEHAETGPGASLPNMGLDVVDDVSGVGAGSENPGDAAGL
jgi:hypothetical protein